MADMKSYGLIGFPLSHSFSKKYFTHKFEHEQIKNRRYELHPIASASEITDLVESNPLLFGLNVTIPHKVEVMAYLNGLDEAASEIGAVNCITIDRSEDKPFLKGYNTDAFGFAESLKPLLKSYHKKALIFGDGGAAQAVKYVLKQLNIPYLTVIRHVKPGTILYSGITQEMLKEYTILINTTPLGMLPNLDSFPPIPYQYLNEQHLAYDLVYNPEETAFLTKVKDRGGATKNGMEMLILQAERSWQIWEK